ncbi:hypothetical protein [Streptomyces sp. CC224B]|uniref:hypothetical protein n=1 Tax=Streptomyces sp. CC224B TaxID=3044571 RepID=UPI0024A8A3CF|nr:hypothetical protein [Streptomyces sp. CC224B]
MRLTVRAPGREIDIRLGQNSTAALRAAEATALRLLAALPGEQPEPEAPFGFTLDTDTERAAPDTADDSTDTDQ